MLTYLLTPWSRVLLVLIIQNTVLWAISAFRVTYSIHLHNILNFEVECLSKILYQQNTNRHISPSSNLHCHHRENLWTNKESNYHCSGHAVQQISGPNFLGFKPELRFTHIFHNISSVRNNAWLFSVYHYLQLCLIRILTQKNFHYFSKHITVFPGKAYMKPST
jgi:hypothetical protein